MATMALAPAAPGDAPRRLTIEEYDRIPDDAFGERVELIEGLIYTKMGQGLARIAALRRVMIALQAAFGEGFVVSVQSPIALGTDSKPEPDLAVLRGTLDDYDARYPDPRNEIALIVEVSDSSLARDVDLKARLYAAHGVPEYWVLDLQARALQIRRRPLDDGVYAETILCPEGETVAVGAGRVSVAALLPRATPPLA